MLLRSAGIRTIICASAGLALLLSPNDPEVKPNRNFRLDSKLLIVTRAHYDGRGTFTAYYYILDNQRLRLIKQARIDNSTP